MKLGITRSADQLSDLAERVARLGGELVPLEFSSVRNLSFEWPDELLPENTDWVIFSSSNGVTSFFERLGKLGISVSSNTKFAANGESTANRLREHRFEPNFIPESASGKALFEQFTGTQLKQGDTVVYARAKKVHTDPENLLTEAGAKYFPIITYEMIPNDVSPETVESLGANDYILFTAPSAAEAYHENFQKPKAHLLAIGPSTAEEMTSLGWTEPVTMKNTDVDSVLEYIPWKCCTAPED
ncbi:MAG: uroporphyrinogen-III synthase [candidate division Zixibacteria bacterium]